MIHSPVPIRWDLKLAAWLRAAGLDHLQAPLAEADRNLVERAVRWADGVDRLEVEPLASKDGTRSIVHPLSGEQAQVAPVAALSAIEDVVRLLVQEGDPRRSLLRLWRVAPHAAFAEATIRQRVGRNSDWAHLPAAPHLPAVTVWERARLASAFAGCLRLEEDRETLALLVVSLGPVQDFIAEARSTSDLWAGSHLIAQLSWEAMRPICEAYGPDSLLVPDLHGVPVVDRWLADSAVDLAGLGPASWKTFRSDAHPLFVATLPNRFQAIVSADLDPALLFEVHEAPRRWLIQRCKRGWSKLLAASPLSPPSNPPANQQIADQLAGFPEVHHVLLPWQPNGIPLRNGGVQSPEALIAEFRSDEDRLEDPRAGALGQPVVDASGTLVYTPSGSLITGLIGEIADHLQAAGKATRAFTQLRQEGYRCTLCGEREWLTLDRTLLPVRPASHRSGCPWCLLTERRPAWVKPGDHLCALCLLKRLWPAVLLEELRRLEPAPRDTVARYVVSTHAMALAPSLDKLIESADPAGTALAFVDASWRPEWRDWSALPRSIAHRLPEGSGLEQRVRRLPLLLDELRELDLPAARELERRLASPDLLGHAPESYYALILMDGDRMGRWFAGDEPTPPLTVGDLWEPQARTRIVEAHPELSAVLSSRRPPDARHVTALSNAIHGFGIGLVRRIVEEQYKGRLLYCGGDDLMAMVAVDDLLEVALTLRTAFSGLEVRASDRYLAAHLPWIEDGSLTLANGFADYDEGRNRRRVRTLGTRATASLGAVICHYAAPLGLALRQLRATEGRAKSDAGRDAFALTLLKRAGGVQTFTARWFAGAHEPPIHLDSTPVGVLLRLRGALSAPLSRRAVYLLSEILHGLGDGAPTGAIESAVRYQLLRQAAVDADSSSITRLAHDLVAVAEKAAPDHRARFLVDALLTAEFLARESRSAEKDAQPILAETAHV